MFGGTRDVGWTHIRFVGDRGRAAAYLPQARLLLGQVRQTIETTGRGVEVVRKKLADGAELEARMVGRVPMVTIRVPGAPSAPTRGPTFDGFVCRPITPDRVILGVDTDDDEFIRREVVLSPDDEGRWTTFFFKAFEPYYGDIAVRKRTYRDREGVPFFPRGIEGFGSSTWRSAKGEALSWVGRAEQHGYTEDYPSRLHPFYGLANRYIVPTLATGTRVYCAGGIVLDVSEYRDEVGSVDVPDHYTVLAAGLRRDEVDGTWLYVVQYAPSTTPIDPITGANGWREGELQVYRYRIARRIEPPGFLARVVNGSRETVGAPFNMNATWELVGEPRFNSSCTELLMTLNPAVEVAVPAGADFSWPNGGFAELRRHDLVTGAITWTSLASTFIEETTGAGESAGFHEYDLWHHWRGDNLRAYRFRRTVDNATGISAELRTPSGAMIPLYTLPNIGSYAVGNPGNQSFYRKHVARMVLAVAPEDGLVALQGVDTTNGPATYTTWHEVWQEQDDGTVALVYDSPRYVLPVDPFPDVTNGDFTGLNFIQGFWARRAFNDNAAGPCFLGLDPTASAHTWNYHRLRGGGIGPSTGFTPHRIPYDLASYYLAGLAPDVLTPPYVPRNVMNTGRVDGTPNVQIASPGVGTAFKATFAGLKAHNGAWILSAHVPYTADRLVTVVSTGDTIHELTGYPASADVQVMPMSVIGRPLFRSA